MEFHKDPKTIDEAVFHVVRFIHERQSREKEPYGERKMKRFTRQVYQDYSSIEDSDTDCEATEISETRVFKDKPTYEKQAKTDKRFQKSEEPANPIHAALLEILTKLGRIVNPDGKKEKRTQHNCYSLQASPRPLGLASTSLNGSHFVAAGILSGSLGLLFLVSTSVGCICCSGQSL